MLITIVWIDHDGAQRISRFALEIDAVRFEESLNAEGLHYHRALSI